MCKKCKHKFESNYHLLYWQLHWLLKLDFDKFFRTWYHIINRKEYIKWFNQKHATEGLLIGYRYASNLGYSEPPDCYIERLSELTPLELKNMELEDEVFK